VWIACGVSSSARLLELLIHFTKTNEETLVLSVNAVVAIVNRRVLRQDNFQLRRRFDEVIIGSSLKVGIKLCLYRLSDDCSCSPFFFFSGIILEY